MTAHDAEERHSRLTLSFLARPGDPVIGALLRSRTPAEVLTVVTGMGEARQAACGSCRTFRAWPLSYASGGSVWSCCHRRAAGTRCVNCLWFQAVPMQLDPATARSLREQSAAPAAPIGLLPAARPTTDEMTAHLRR
jgi:hypothetical protein